MGAALFPLGRIVATPGALELLASTGTDTLALLSRHASGDWGDLDGFDRGQNDRALKTGARLFSAYETPGGRVWIITEATDDAGARRSTCILLPEEY